jgi:hypothetical protein
MFQRRIGLACYPHVMVSAARQRFTFEDYLGDHWILNVARGNETATVDSIACALPLAEVYRDPLEE